MAAGKHGRYLLYIHSNLGSTAVGDNAIPRADPKAVWSRNMDITKDFMLEGALVKAYSKPVMLAKISDIAIKKYAGACTAT